MSQYDKKVYSEGRCPICNNKSLRKYKNFFTCTHCEGTPIRCYNDVTMIYDGHPDDVEICPRCNEVMTGATHLFFLT